MHPNTMTDSYCASDGLPALPLFSAADKHATRFPGKAALIDVKARRSFTYRELLAGTARIKNLIFKALGVHGADVQEQRIAYLVPSGIDYVQIQWGIWAAGGVAVPLCTTHPFHELEYTVANSKPTLIFLHHDFSQHKSAFLTKFPSIKVLDVPFTSYDTDDPNFLVPATAFYSSFSLSRRALIIYTSGTTSRPKGCVTTHANIDFQANSLVKAWKYTSSDYLIHILPLHHVHGIINGLTATLLAGGTVELHPKFDPVVVWKRWMDGDSTMFMAVPTVYSRLNSYFLEHISGTDDEQGARDSTRSLRLTVSGSAALPTSIKQRFKDITGQVLLERYGMTEIGMGLSCLYDDSDGRGRPDGSVGWPLDGVEVRLMQDDGRIIALPLGTQSTDDGGSMIASGSQVVTKTRSNNDGIPLTGLQNNENMMGTDKIQAHSLSQSSEFQGIEQHSVPESSKVQLGFQDREVLAGTLNTEVSTRAPNHKTSTGKSDSESFMGTFQPESVTKSSNPEPLTEAHNTERPIGTPYPEASVGIEHIESSTGTHITGEIQIRGPNVFKEYWENPDATAKEFTEDGYFKTGDVAYRDEHGAYYIQGRSSVDIIKSGGYKISALDVEREVLSNIPHVKEAVVVGIPDEEWGERVAAVLVMENGMEGLELKEFRNMLRSTLAPYKIPTLLKVVGGIERNAMGKVNKKQLVKDLWPRLVSQRNSTT
ncbi:hypothetical protein TWF281_001532 [Arthrobotrys megalospora]